MIYTGYPELLE